MVMQDFDSGICCLKTAIIGIGVLGVFGSVAMVVISNKFIMDPLWYVRATYELNAKEKDAVRMLDSLRPTLDDLSLIFFLSLAIMGIALVILNVILIFGAVFEKRLLVKSWIVGTSIISPILGILGLVWMMQLNKRGSRDFRTALVLFIGGKCVTVIFIMMVRYFYRKLTCVNIHNDMDRQAIIPIHDQ